MRLMRKRDLIEMNGPFLNSNMAERGTGHVRPDFLRPITSIVGCQGLLGLIVGYVEKLDRILDVVDTPAQVDEAKVVPGFVEEGLGLLNIRRFPLGLF